MAKAKTKKKARDLEVVPKEKPAKTAKAVKSKTPTADDYLESLRKMRGKEEPDWGRLSDKVFNTTVTEWIPTGCLAIDRLTGGGWPVGKIVEVAGWQSTGKSTLLDQSIAQVQRMGGVAALVDSEQARDEVYTKRLGVDTDKLIVHLASTVEEVFAGVDTLLDLQEKMKASLKGAEPPAMLIVWDSVGGTPTNREKEGEADDLHVGAAARVIRLNLRRICGRLSDLRAVLVCANHFYKTIGPFATLQTYGGNGIPYFSSVRVWLTNKGKLKVGDTQVGHVMEAKLKKTKVNKPHPPIEAGLVYGSGIDNSYTLYDWGKLNGVSEAHRWVTQHGAWSYLMLPDGTHEGFQGGFAGLGAVLQQKPEIYQQMAEQFLGAPR